MDFEVRSPKDFYAGLLFAAIGAVAFVSALGYDIGTATKMGPGFFPAAVGIILFALGAASVVRGLVWASPDRIERRSLWPILWILFGVFSFSFLIDRAGLVAAIVVLLTLSCSRRVFSRPIEVLMIIAVLTVFSVSLFIYGFGMPMNAF